MTQRRGNCHITCRPYNIMIIALMTLGGIGVHFSLWVGHGTINFSTVVGRGIILLHSFIHLLHHLTMFLLNGLKMAFLYTLLAAAVVGLERTFYQVSEDVGVVEVCAIVYNPSGACPITFPFLSTSEDAVSNRAGNVEWYNYIITIIIINFL